MNDDAFNTRAAERSKPSEGFCFVNISRNWLIYLVLLIASNRAPTIYFYLSLIQCTKMELFLNIFFSQPSGFFPRG